MGPQGTTHRAKRMLAAAFAIALIAAGCASSAKSGPGGGQSITVGVLADITGPGATISGTFLPGVKAGIGAIAAPAGYNIKYVVVDTGTTPGGVLSGAQQLVEQDHVFAVLPSSLLLFAGASYLSSHNIPVIGPAIDGEEWITSPNMLSILGYQDYRNVYSMIGDFFKSRGVTSLASIGYSIEPSSKEVSEANAVSAEVAGVKTGYLNVNFPLGSTNVDPIVLAMKSAGVDGLSTGIITNSAFALVRGLQEQGVKVKANLLPTGYGGDLVGGGPGAERDAQGSYFLTGAEPAEMHTAATEKFQNALRTYAGVTGDPTLEEYNGYLAVGALVAGLKAAGAHPTQASLINTMLGLSYDGQGLWSGHKLSFAMNRRGGAISSVDNCIWITQYLGSTFHLVPGFDPICGHQVPGKRVPS